MKHFLLLMLLLATLCAGAQTIRFPYVETIGKAATEGITIAHLDSQYRSAVHVDSTKAVFKSGSGQDSLISAYGNFLQQFGGYLRNNGFKWEQPSHCWNRIYFNKNGSVDYYLFNFRTEISDPQLARFKELFATFATTHKIGITADEPFAQCSPVTYMDN